ncbi:signal peptidase II [Haloimpatiens sp. FM7330]|uniref:signal peptidase II n=1 Tax=Haloimpatiens sp. FM7330 TaxID=3298610 RepID=UPI00363611B9
MKKNLKLMLSVIILTVIDQIIKVYVFKNFMNKEYDILGNIISFRPHINIDYSWINSFSKMGIGLLPHVICCIIMLIISVVIFQFFKEKYHVNMFVHYVFSLWCAGVVCSLIDKIFWGGSLDYIRLNGFFIFDLKDIYISICEVIVIGGLIFNYKKLNDVNEKVFYNEFKTYIKSKYMGSK